MDGFVHWSRPMQTEILPSPTRKVAFTLKEAAHASGLSRSLLYVAIGRGALRARKCGARTLILDSDLRRFLRSLPALAKAETRLSTG
jgi:hypothetical protein